MTETEAYHSEQIEAVAVTQADLVSAFTLGYPEELGMLVGDLCRRFTHLRIIGGCRGARTETHDTRSRKGPLSGGLSTHSARQKKGSPSP